MQEEPIVTEQSGIEQPDQQRQLDELNFQQQREKLSELWQTIPIQEQDWKYEQLQWEDYKEKCEQRIREFISLRSSLSEQFGSASDKGKEEIQAKMFNYTNEIALVNQEREVELAQRVDSTFQLSGLYTEIANAAKTMGITIEERARVYGYDRLAAKTETEGYYDLERQYREKATYYQEFGHALTLRAFSWSY